jgi:hypothetical protein
MGVDTLPIRPTEELSGEKQVEQAVIDREKAFWRQSHNDVMQIEGVVTVGLSLMTDRAIVTVNRLHTDREHIQQAVMAILEPIGYGESDIEFREGNPPAVIKHAILFTGEKEETKQAA